MDDGSKENPVEIIENVLKNCPFEDVLPSLFKRQFFSSPSVVYRRMFVEKFDWNEDARFEDYELYLKLSAEVEFARNEKFLYGWRQNGANGKMRLLITGN